MASNTFKLDYSQAERLQQAMNKYEGYAGREIDDVLHNEGGKLITEEIMRLLPESGRKWVGKKAAAKRAKPFEQKNESLSVTIRTVPAYHYLYFPDDGSNTTRHAGQQHFMFRGAENQTARIMELCINRLIEKLGE